MSRRCYRRMSHSQLMWFAEGVAEKLIERYDLEHLHDSECKEIDFAAQVRRIAHDILRRGLLCD